MAAMDDLKWLIFVLLGLFVAWLIFGPGGGSYGPFIRPPSPFGDSSSYGRSINQGDEPVSEPGDDSSIDITDLRGELNQILGLANSKYKGVVEISRYSSAKESSADREYIELRVSRNATGKIPISDWKLESAVSGIEFELGKGSAVPYSGRVNAESYIFVEAGEKIVVSTGRSPIGVSFKLNKCTGYFEQSQDFRPSLPRECPRPIDDLPNQGVGNLAEMCVEFVEDLSRCEVYIDPVPIDLDGSCQEYLATKINYNSCVDFHRNDSDFYRKEWRVYLGRSEEIWRKRREIIKLVDNENRVVDAISY